MSSNFLPKLSNQHKLSGLFALRNLYHSLHTKFIPLLLVLVLCASCTSNNNAGTNPNQLTVSLPVVKYFVDRLAPDSVQVNVMIPRGADHDSYTPKPSQMTALAQSRAYIALGPLEFEQTWKDRFLSSAPFMTWAEMTPDVRLIAEHHGHHAHGGEEHHNSGHCCGHGADPHYWLSPKEVRPLCGNIAALLRNLYPQSAAGIDSSLAALLADVDRFDVMLDSAAQAHPGRMFVVYHPSLSYLARDYGFRQLSLGNEGAAPQPQRFAALVDSAKAGGADVVFLQRGQSPDKVASVADAIGGRIVTLQPDAEEWDATMNVLIETLR